MLLLLPSVFRSSYDTLRVYKQPFEGSNDNCNRLQYCIKAAASGQNVEIM